MPLSSKDTINCGNHSKQPCAPEQPGEKRHNYIYHWTAICGTIVNGAVKQFWASCNGWPTMSTKHAVSMYRNTLRRMGYEEIVPPAWVRA